MTEQEQKAFEAWAEPILGDNPAWRERGEGELARQAWSAALTAANAVSEQPKVIQVMGLNVVLDPTMAPNEMKLVQPQAQGEPIAWVLEWTFNGEERGRRLYDDETHCKFDAEQDGGICRPLVYGDEAHPQATEPAGWKLVEATHQPEIVRLAKVALQEMPKNSATDWQEAAKTVCQSVVAQKTWVPAAPEAL